MLGREKNSESSLCWCGFCGEENCAEHSIEYCDVYSKVEEPIREGSFNRAHRCLEENALCEVIFNATPENQLAKSLACKYFSLVKNKLEKELIACEAEKPDNICKFFR